MSSAFSVVVLYLSVFFHVRLTEVGNFSVTVPVIDVGADSSW
jgi:hypothetical protein